MTVIIFKENERKSFIDQGVFFFKTLFLSMCMSVPLHDINLSIYGTEFDYSFFILQEWLKDKVNRSHSAQYVWNATAFYDVDLRNTDFLLGKV